MTEAELLEAASNNWSNVISLMTIFISVVSGYLVIGYLVGKELNTKQVALVNALYGAFVGFCVYAVYMFSSAAVEHGNLALEISRQRSMAPSQVIPVVFVSINIPIILASYKFMWDIRQPG